ncbi:MAG TPA: hypothetical protein VM223_14345 [Planctomycetota bacterium]|nr:hypothetical protein [Planctomycetota bacterium]
MITSVSPMFWLLAITCILVLPAAAGDLPPIGEWDGVTESAKLETPYEDPSNYSVPFGILSYYCHFWRGYMDTWPAQKWLDLPAAQWNVNDKYAEPLCTILKESGIVALRVEIGWGSMAWDGDDLQPHVKARLLKFLPILQKNGIRPLMLLNAHHGVPCPVRDVPVDVVTEAKKGDRILKVKSADGIRVGYTGIQHPAYIAAYPLVTGTEPADDGVVVLHLSAKLPIDINPGRFTLKELKYQPMQGTKRKDGTPVPESQATMDGWLKYAAAVGRCVREALGTKDKPDAGFDVEVWNEQTFGSNFLRIQNYYDEKPEYAEEFVYRRTRELKPGMRPDARLEFEQKGCYAILPMTIDYFNDPANGFRQPGTVAGVRVISGFANQWPWDSGSALWDGQSGFSRHYYTGGWRDCSPQTPLGRPGSGVINALGQFEGNKDGRDWHTVELGSFFVPTFRLACPEYFHHTWQTETISRDVLPDSRFSGMGQYGRDRHGRYTHNGDFHIAQISQTEVNYDRSPFFNSLFKQGVAKDDPRALALDRHMAGKMLLRQYIFHCHKGLYRIYIFCLESHPFSLGMFPKAFYEALDKNDCQLTDEVRATVPPEFTGMAWLKNLMKTGEKLDATRALRVDELVEYKPRLVFAGDGTPAHSDRWNRDQFAFLPFQLSANKFAIPYYVVTLDVTHEWDRGGSPRPPILDPARYDMPDQEFDVTIGNIRGSGAEVSAYDPLTNTEVPVKIVKKSATQLTVRLQTVDYPRILQVTEAKPGPQIIAPKVELTQDNKAIRVSWNTNIDANCIAIYGRDWPQRSANRVEPDSTKNAWAAQIPVDKPCVAAVRICATANGITCTWPRWDEDPAGQIVIPGAESAVGANLVFAPADDSSSAEPSAEPVRLPPVAQVPAGSQFEANRQRNYVLTVPGKFNLAGPADDREGKLGGVVLRIRYVAGGGKAIDDALPFTATGDTVDRQLVILPSGLKGTMVKLELQPTAHPGVIDLAQWILLLPMGQNGADLLAISAMGEPEAMKKNTDPITAIFASVRLAQE